MELLSYKSGPHCVTLWLQRPNAERVWYVKSCIPGSSADHRAASLLLLYYVMLTSSLCHKWSNTCKRHTFPTLLGLQSHLFFSHCIGLCRDITQGIAVARGEGFKLFGCFYIFTLCVSHVLCSPDILIFFPSTFTILSTSVVVLSRVFIPNL